MLESKKGLYTAKPLMGFFNHYESGKSPKLRSMFYNFFSCLLQTIEKTKTEPIKMDIMILKDSLTGQGIAERICLFLFPLPRKMLDCIPKVSSQVLFICLAIDSFL